MTGVQIPVVENVRQNIVVRKQGILIFIKAVLCFADVLDNPGQMQFENFNQLQILGRKILILIER